jgi:N-acetylmuramoyl-L-alanine amidase CwlA
MDRLSKPCDRSFYPAYHNSGKRDLSEIKWIVLHDEEASTARSAAVYFQDPDSGGSAHLCVDDKECYRCLANEDVPWAAPYANHEGFHIEQAGFAKWSAVIWKSHVNTIRRAAYKAAVHAKQFDIPIVFLKAEDLHANKRGITTHREVTRAFGGTHTDPGPLYPTSMFMFFAKRYRKELG